MKRRFPHFLPTLLQALPRQLTLLDVGARGGAQWPWDALLPTVVDPVLVEPDPLEAKRLMEALPAGRGTVLPVVLWSNERSLTLFINKAPGTSSVFSANWELIDQFPEAERFRPVSTVDVCTRTIDGLTTAGEMPALDFAKIDAQGAELAILEGGASHLASNLLGLEVEVEFAPLYSGQPLFANVDSFVREKLGLELWDLGTNYWKYKRGMNAPGPNKGRLMFSDALYLRPLNNIDKWLDTMSPEAAEEKVVLLAVCAMAYGYHDYALAVLDAPQLQERCEPRRRESLKDAIGARGSGFRPCKNGNRVLHFLFNALGTAFWPSHGGWAANGAGVGSRKRGPFWS